MVKRLFTLAVLLALMLAAKAATHGDVNGDGVADIDDLNAVINVMLHKNADTGVEARADIDGNGVVDIDDLNVVINVMVGKWSDPDEINTIDEAWNALTYPCRGYAAFCELATDNIVDNNAPTCNTGGRWDPMNLEAYYDVDSLFFAWQPAPEIDWPNDTPTGYWVECYSSIAEANRVLEAANRLAQQFTDADSRAQLDQLRGEALLIRAYCHWQLCNIFCMPYAGANRSRQFMGLPYLTTSDTLDVYKAPRPSLEQTYQLIEADLLEGLPLVGDHWTGQTLIGTHASNLANAHFNPNAANAFAARFYLYKRDYAKVVDYANAAFGDTAPDEWMADDIWTLIHRWEISYLSDFVYHTDNRPGVWLKHDVYSTWFRHFRFRYACNRDALFSTLFGEGPTWTNCRWRNTYLNETYSMHPAYVGTLYTSGPSEQGVFFGGNVAEVFEYTDTLVGIGYAHEIPAEFTANETLLCRAEAYAFLGNLEAAFADLKAWEANLRLELDVYDTARLVDLTDELIRNYYNTRLEAYNANVANVDTLGNQYFNKIYYGQVRPISIDAVCPSSHPLTDNIMPYVQCVQHFRRLDGIHTGMRFFDLKRLGIKVTHTMGADGHTDSLDLDDPRWAIQIPPRAIAAGMTPNPR